MMFPIGTGRRKSDLLPHRAHAVALIWKMISVQFEPINIILVSPVNDTFLPSIVALTEEEMCVREEVKKGEGGGGRKEVKMNPPGSCIQQGSPSPLKLHPDIPECSHSHLFHTLKHTCRNING